MATKVSPKKSRSSKIFLLLVPLLIAGLILILLEKTKTTDLIKMPTPSHQSGPTEEETELQKRTEVSQKEQFINSTDKTGQPLIDSDTPPTLESKLLKLAVNQEGTSVTVLTKIQNVAEGICKLTVVNGSKSTTQTARIIYQSEFSSCAGFSVPVSALGTGPWNITVTVTPSSNNALTESTTIEVR